MSSRVDQSLFSTVFNFVNRHSTYDENIARNLLYSDVKTKFEFKWNGAGIPVHVCLHSGYIGGSRSDVVFQGGIRFDTENALNPFEEQARGVTAEASWFDKFMVTMIRCDGLEETNEALACLMTIKNAVAGLPRGGGKITVCIDRRRLTPADFRTFLNDLGVFLGSHGVLERFLPGVDVNAYPKDVSAILEKASPERKCLAVRISEKTPRNGIDSTAYFTLKMSKFFLDFEKVPDDIKWAGFSCAVHGFGNVGYEIVKLLQLKSARVQCICNSRVLVGSGSEEGINLVSLLGTKEETSLNPENLNETIESNKQEMFQSFAEVAVDKSGWTNAFLSECVERGVRVVFLASREGVFCRENAEFLESIGAPPMIFVEVANGAITREADEFLFEKRFNIDDPDAFSARGHIVIPDVMCNLGATLLSYMASVEGVNTESLRSDYYKEAQRRATAIFGWVKKIARWFYLTRVHEKLPNVGIDEKNMYTTQRTVASPEEGGVETWGSVFERIFFPFCNLRKIVYMLAFFNLSQGNSGCFDESQYLSVSTNPEACADTELSLAQFFHIYLSRIISVSNGSKSDGVSCVAEVVESVGGQSCREVEIPSEARAFGCVPLFGDVLYRIEAITDHGMARRYRLCLRTEQNDAYECVGVVTFTKDNDSGTATEFSLSQIFTPNGALDIVLSGVTTILHTGLVGEKVSAAVNHRHLNINPQILGRLGFMRTDTPGLFVWLSKALRIMPTGLISWTVDPRQSRESRASKNEGKNTFEISVIGPRFPIFVTTVRRNEVIAEMTCQVDDDSVPHTHVQYVEDIVFKDTVLPRERPLLVVEMIDYLVQYIIGKLSVAELYTRYILRVPEEHVGNASIGERFQYHVETRMYEFIWPVDRLGNTEDPYAQNDLDPSTTPVLYVGGDGVVRVDENVIRNRFPGWGDEFLVQFEDENNSLVVYRGDLQLAKLWLEYTTLPGSDENIVGVTITQVHRSYIEADLDAYAVARGIQELSVLFPMVVVNTDVDTEIEPSFLEEMNFRYRDDKPNAMYFENKSLFHEKRSSSSRSTSASSKKQESVQFSAQTRNEKGGPVVTGIMQSGYNPYPVLHLYVFPDPKNPQAATVYAKNDDAYLAFMTSELNEKEKQNNRNRALAACIQTLQSMYNSLSLVVGETIPSIKSASDSVNMYLMQKLNFSSSGSSKSLQYNWTKRTNKSRSWKDVGL